MRSKIEKIMMMLLMLYITWVSHEMASVDGSSGKGCFEEKPVKNFTFQYEPKEDDSWPNCTWDTGIKKLQCQGQKILKYAKNGKYGKVQQLLNEEGIDKAFVLNHTDIGRCCGGFTALLWAAKKNHTKMLQLLIDQGSDVTQISDSKYTALYYAAENGNMEAAKLLISKNASVNKEAFNGYTPLLIATENNFPSMVEYLLKNGAKANTKVINTDIRPLLVAVQKSLTPIVDLLLNNKSNPNETTFGYTPILAAADIGHIDIMKKLIDKKANPNIKTVKTGYFPLYYCAKRGFPELVRLLLENNANLSLQTSTGETALIVATAWGRSTIVNQLLERGADPNVVDKKKTGPLHRAAYYGYTDILKKLLDKKADVNVQNDEGWTPLHFSAKGWIDDLWNIMRRLEHREEIKTDTRMATLCELLKKSPNATITDEKGQTALDIAKSAEQKLSKLDQTALEEPNLKNKADMIKKAYETFISNLSAYPNKRCS